jgi:phage portal protein BeeE
MKRDELTPSRVGISRYFESCGFGEVPKYVEEYPLYPEFGTPSLYDGQPMTEAPKGEHSIIHIKETHADFKYWGTPSYLAGKLAAQSEYKINKFNNSQLDNGFMPSGIVQFFGNTTQDKAKLIIDKFRESYTGTGNNSRLVAQFIADPTNAAKFTQLTQAYEGQFLEMFDLAQRQIIIAHEWSPALAGMTIAGQLGNTQQLKVEFEVTKNTVIKHYQDILKNQWFKPILKTAGAFMGFNWSSLSLQVLPMALIGLLEELNASEVMTEEEKRAELGLTQEIEIEEPTNNVTDANNINT